MKRLVVGVAGIVLAGSAVLILTRPSPTIAVKEARYDVLPGAWEDAVRLVVMALAGLTLGFLFLIAHQFTKLKIDERDRLISPLSGVAFSYFLLILFASWELLSRVGTSWLTWRTPLGGACFIFSTISLWRLCNRLGVTVRRARASGAVVKMTLTDTGKPGPDIDLDTGAKVVSTDVDRKDS